MHNYTVRWRERILQMMTCKHQVPAVNVGRRLPIRVYYRL